MKYFLLQNLKPFPTSSASSLRLKYSILLRQMFFCFISPREPSVCPALLHFFACHSCHFGCASVISFTLDVALSTSYYLWVSFVSCRKELLFCHCRLSCVAFMMLLQFIRNIRSDALHWRISCYEYVMSVPETLSSLCIFFLSSLLYLSVLVSLSEIFRLFVPNRRSQAPFLRLQRSIRYSHLFSLTLLQLHRVVGKIYLEFSN